MWRWIFVVLTSTAINPVLTILSGSALSAAQPSSARVPNGSGHRNALRRAAFQNSSQFVFASVQRRSEVLVFKDSNPSAPSRIIHDLCAPNGLAVDSAKSLYVAQVCVGSGVAVIPPGKSKPVATLIDPGYLSAEVVVAADKTAYVMSNGGSLGSAGHVAIFAPGTTSPTSFISDFCGRGLGIALDSSENVYISFYDCNSGTAHVRKYLAGQTQGTDLMLQGLIGPGGMAIDGSGNLLIANASQGDSEIDVFAPAATVAFAKYHFDAIVNSVALSADGQTLFAAIEHIYTASYVYSFQYPAVKLINKFRLPMREHVSWAAVSPARF